MNGRPRAASAAGLSVGLVLGLASAVLASAGRAQQPVAFVRATVARSDVVAQEAVRVQVKVGIDREYFRSHAVQLFRQELDVPVQIVAPWLDGSTSLLRLPDAALESAGPGLSLALNDDVVRAQRLPDEVRDGRTFTVVQLERRLSPGAPGQLSLEAPLLRYAAASAFRDDFVNGRVPVDRTDATVTGEALTLAVAALPAEGRPPDFGGAVGTFTLQATASPRELAVGERLQLDLLVAGDGNLQALQPPRVDALPGFHSYGVLDRGEPHARTLRCELAPLDTSVTAVPRIGLSFFVPGPNGGYRTAWTEPIPLVVRPGTAPPPPPPPRPVAPASPDLADLRSAAALPRDVAARPDDAFAVSLLLLPWLLWLTSLGFRHSRARRRAAPALPAAALAHRFAALAERRDPDLAAAYADYLAVRLGAAAAEAGADDVAELLRRAGASSDLALRAARLRQSLAAARYGGISASAAVAAQAIVSDLEDALRRGPERT